MFLERYYRSMFFLSKYSSNITFNFNFNFNFKNRTSKDKSKRRHLGWHTRAQLKPNPEPYRALKRVLLGP
jgi:hypothetical protein